jgi:hypothetical protein
MNHSKKEDKMPTKTTTTKTTSMKTAIVLAIVLAPLTSIAATAVPLQNVYATGTDGGDGGEGCTPGFWKNHPFPEPYTPETLFKDVFGVTIAGDEDLTLGEALRLSGGGENALARHAVAALLNAASEEVDFEFTGEEVIAKVQNAIATGNIEAVKNQFDRENNRGCPI